MVLEVSSSSLLSGEGADIKCESSPAAAGDTLEFGRVPPSYGWSLPTVS